MYMVLVVVSVLVLLLILVTTGLAPEVPGAGKTVDGLAYDATTSIYLPLYLSLSTCLYTSPSLTASIPPPLYLLLYPEVP